MIFLFIKIKNRVSSIFLDEMNFRVKCGLTVQIQELKNAFDLSRDIN